MSGAPGTGKTATLTHLLKSKTSDYKSVFLNCMVLKSSIQIFKEVAKQLNPKTSAKSEKEALKEIEKFTTGKGPMVLLGNNKYEIKPNIFGILLFFSWLELMMIGLEISAGLELISKQGLEIVFDLKMILSNI